MIFLQALAGFGSVVILVTIVALLNDQPRRSPASTVAGWLRHHARRLALVLMGAGATMALLSVLTGQPISLDVAVLVTAVALRQAAHPAGWARFVFAPVGETGDDGVERAS